MGVAAVWVMIGGFRSDWVTGGDVLALSSLAVGVWEATSNSLAGKMNQISKFCSTTVTLRYHLDNTQLHHLVSFHYTSSKMIIGHLVL